MKHFALALLVLATSGMSCKHAGASGGSEVLSAPRRPDNPGEPGAADRANPSHFEGPFTVAGAYDFDPAKLADHYDGLTANRFGTVEPSLPDGSAIKDISGRQKVVRDLHYHLGGGKVGIRPLPVADDDEEGELADGKKIKGSAIVDSYLRKAMNLGESDPIYAVIGYMHPEFHKGTIVQFTEAHLKLENGQTHLGAYIGGGRTRNSPKDYHRQTWSVAEGGKGYPANISIVSLDGVDQKTFNQNATIALRLLNEAGAGVKFPPDYKFDYFRAVNLKETLDFFHGWLDKDWKRPGDAEPFQKKLYSDPSYATYCAEHITISLNLALNVEQSLAGYKEVWGDADGARLWDLATKVFKNDIGEDLVPVSGYKPLWKQLGITEPLKTMELGRSLAWPAETTADLISNFVEQYAAWPDVGAVVSTTVVLGFAGKAVERMGIDLPSFLTKALPVIAKMFPAEAATMPWKSKPDPGAAYDQYVAGVKGALVKVLGDMAAKASLPAAMLTGAVVPAVEQALAASKSRLITADPVGVDKAWDGYRDAVKAEMEAARETPVKASPEESAPGAKYVQYYTPPAVVHRVTSGIHPLDSHVHIVTVATAMPAEELRESGKDETTYTVGGTAAPAAAAEPDAPAATENPDAFPGESPPPEG